MYSSLAPGVKVAFRIFFFHLYKPQNKPNVGTGTGILFPKNLLDNPDRATLTYMNICKHLSCFSYGTGGTGTAVQPYSGTFLLWSCSRSRLKILAPSTLIKCNTENTDDGMGDNLAVVCGLTFFVWEFSF